jgi:hypothetical protein
MCGLKQVHHLVYDDILEALLGLLGELGINPNSPGGRITASPLGFHPLVFVQRKVEEVLSAEKL